MRLRLSRTKLIKILVGIVYTIIGLAIFLTGVNVGFMPAGRFLGAHLASASYNWILIPLSALLGFFIVAAEPAVHVLNKQVEDITSGAISQKIMMAGLSIGVSVAVCLAMIRIMFQINIWYFLLPGYLLALGLTFVTPKVFTAIAFDSGGVAAGTMAAAFLLPFGVGVCEAFGGNVMTDAFGMVAMVATMPLITIQLIGVIFQHKSRTKAQAIAVAAASGDDDLIIEIDSGLEAEYLPEAEADNASAEAAETAPEEPGPLPVPEAMTETNETIEETQ